MISYEEYVEKLKTGLMCKTQLPEEKVYFCRKGEKFAENGDRLVIECVEAEKEKGALGMKKIHKEKLFLRWLIKLLKKFDRYRKAVY